MLSWTLLKTTAKKNWVLLLIFFAVLTMYTTIMISMFSPEDMSQIMSMLDLFPEDLMKAMGFSALITDLTGYLASWLYGLLMFGFPMVYCIILGNRLVAKMVDNSSFACLLSTPNSRTKIIMTQGLYALASLTVLFAALFGLGVFVSAVMQPDQLDIAAYFKLNVTTLLVNMVVMMISFFSSCLFNESRSALGLGAGIPIAFLLMNMLGGVSEQAIILKKVSIYGFYDPVLLVKDGQTWGLNLIYGSVVVVLFVSAVLIFKKKRLPL
jgi:ABC-2 type transport system permease protein